MAASEFSIRSCTRFAGCIPCTDTGSSRFERSAKTFAKNLTYARGQIPQTTPQLIVKMPDSSNPVLAIDRYLWMAIGVFVACATYTTQSQLKTFKKRCVSKPSPLPSSDAAVDRTTENAIKLETLEALARGINFDLRNAALKIITERATTNQNIDFLLKQIEGRNVPARLRALKAMRCLSMRANSFINLCTQRTFRALVTCLKNTLPPTPDAATQKETLYILARLMTSFFQGKDLAVEAGIIEWLQQVKIPGYQYVVDAVLDPERFDTNDTSLWEVVTTIMDEHDGGRKLLIESGLMAACEDEDERGVEIEVEAEIVDVATARRARREAGILGGLLQETSFPGESRWT